MSIFKQLVMLTTSSIEVGGSGATVTMVDGYRQRRQSLGSSGEQRSPKIKKLKREVAKKKSVYHERHLSETGGLEQI